MMKKLLSLLLALAMLLGCAAFAEGVDYTGLWTLTSMEANGMVMDPMAMGLEMTMTLNEDGTCVLTAMGESENGTWAVTETGVAVTDGAGVVDDFTLVDGTLVAEQEGAKIIFTYGEAAAPAGPVALAGVDPKAFEGQWQLSSVNMMGMNFPAEDMGAYMAFVLSEGVGIYAETDENGELLQLDVTYTVTEVEGVGTVLELIYAGELVAEPTVLLSLNMLEDGSLYMGANLEGLTVAYYFTQPAAEEAAAE